MADIQFNIPDELNKQEKRNKEQIIEDLRKIRRTDKYHNFHKIIPGVADTPDHEQDTINEIIEDCCTELVRHYLSRKAPTRALVRNIILKHMDLISYAEVNTENKDFGYELCWYIAEKTGVPLRKYTDTKVYGYWKVEGTKLKAVTKRGNKKKKDNSQ